MSPGPQIRILDLLNMKQENKTAAINICTVEMSDSCNRKDEI